MSNHKSAMNIPNILSVIRILLTPLFIICMMKGSFSIGLVVFAIAGISDALDGLLARLLDQHTVLGAYLDPIADKILLMSAFVSLAVLKIIPGWLAVIVISRDIFILAGFAIFVTTNTKIEIKPSVISKCTTVIQSLTIFFTLLDPDLSDAWHIVSGFLCWLTACVTIMSGLHYIYMGMSVFQNGSKKYQGGV